MEEKNEKRLFQRRSNEVCAEYMNAAEVKERLARAEAELHMYVLKSAAIEQDLKNQKDTFLAFKSEEFSDLKAEVHTIRSELNLKIDNVIALLDSFKSQSRLALEDFKTESRNHISKINETMSKWFGAAGVIIVIVEIVIKKYI